MIIYERKYIPRPNLHRISVPPGQKIDIGVQKMFLVDETDQADCNKSEGGDFAFLPNVVYFRYACQENALYENIANKCTRGCVQHPYRLEIGPYANTPNCTLSNLCCLLHEYSNYDRNSTCTHAGILPMNTRITILVFPMAVLLLRLQIQLTCLKRLLKIIFVCSSLFTRSPNKGDDYVLYLQRGSALW